MATALKAREDRYYQREAHEAIHNHLVDGCTRQLIAIATGGGKTDIAAQMPIEPWFQKFTDKRQGKRILFCVHRENLVRQTALRYALYSKAKGFVSIEQADNWATDDSQVVVASVQTLNANNCERLKRFNPDDFAVIIPDEAHHAPANSYMEIFRHFRLLPPKDWMPFKADAQTRQLQRDVQRIRRAKQQRMEKGDEGKYTNDEKTELREKRKKIGAAKIEHERKRLALWDENHKGERRVLIGLTATPDRADKLALEHVFSRIVYYKSMIDLIRDGFLLPPKPFRIETDTDLDDIKVAQNGANDSDFATAELARRINNERRNKAVLRAYQDHGDGRKAIGFAADVQHAHDMAQVFCDAGIPSKAIDGSMNDTERKEIFDDYAAGRIWALWNCMIATEGFDEPSIGVVIMARATKSRNVYTQMVGRGLRPFEGLTNCIILDIVDVCRKHRLVTAPTLLGLPSNFKTGDKDLLQIANTLDKAKEEYPHMNTESLTSLEELEIRAHEVNVFEPFADPVVENFSPLSWMRVAADTFSISFTGEMSESNTMQIGLNPDGDFEVNLIEYGAGRPVARTESLPEAFRLGDAWIRKNRPDIAGLLSRKAAWQKDPASPAQKRYLARELKKLGKINSFDVDNMKKGQASLLTGLIKSGMLSKVQQPRKES